MDSFKNNLPIAVHQVGGGEAMKRTGSLIIPLDGTISGSFSTGTASKIRVFANLRTNTDILILLSCDTPATIGNAVMSICDREVFYEYPKSAILIHYHLIDIAMLSDRAAGANDYLCVTFYE
jgi:hypothetical protein